MRRELPRPPPVLDRTRPRPTRPWSELVDYFRRLGGGQTPMVRLVEHVAASPYANKVFGDTSMTMLVVAQTPEILERQEIICVEHADAQFDVALRERGYADRDDPVRRVPTADGISTFERMLRAKRWD